MEAARQIINRRAVKNDRGLRLIEGKRKRALSAKILTLFMVVICLSILFNVIERTAIIENMLTEDNLINTLKEEKIYKEKLMAEIAKLKSPERIEEIALNELGMVVPEEVNYVKIVTGQKRPGELAMKSMDKPDIR